MRDFLEVIEEGERLTPSLGEQAKKVSNFDVKLKKLISLMVNESGMASHKREYLMREAATTSDFPILFGTVLERSLLAKYTVDSPDWQSYIKTGTQNDFRLADAIGVYGLQSGLSVVAERGEYKQDAQLGEGKIQIGLKKYGRMFGLGWETIINDDLGALNDIAERLAVAARRTEWREATKLLATTTGPLAALYATTPGVTHPIDGKSIINKYALALTGDNIATVLASLRRQTDADGEPIIITGFHLVVPPALEYTAMKVLNPAALIMAGGDSTDNTAPVISTSANVVAGMGITLHVNPYLPIVDTSAGKDKTWYLFADLGSGYAAKLNFLRGHEAPELVMKAPNKLSLAGGAVNPFDGNFEEDSIWWRVRHVMGGTQFDPRMTACSVAP